MAYNKGGARKGRKKVCVFCVEKVDEIDYKDVTRLKKFTSERAKILPRRVTGTCAKERVRSPLCLIPLTNCSTAEPQVFYLRFFFMQFIEREIKEAGRLFEPSRVF